MPGGDGTGPMGRGALTGRGLGACSDAGYRNRSNYGFGCRRGFGRGFAGGLGRGFGRGAGFGFFAGSVEPEDEKDFLQQQKEFYKDRLDAIDKELENY